MTEMTTPPKLTKLLLNVTVQRSLGPVQVLISLESTVGNLVAAALRQYSKECRWPLLPSLDPYGFDLHYSHFSLESLAPDEKLVELGSRNFFLCHNQAFTTVRSSGGHGGITTSPSSSSSSSSTCLTEVEKATNSLTRWLRFMEFMI